MNDYILRMITTSLSLGTLKRGISGYFKQSLIPNFYALETIIGKAWIHLSTLKQNNETMDA